MSLPADAEHVQDEAPQPKRRATKRGLSNTLNLDQVSGGDADIKSHITSVYSSCVQRSELNFNNLPRKPLFNKQDNGDAKISEPEPATQLVERPRRAVRTVVSPDLEPVVSLCTGFNDDIEIFDEDENSIISLDNDEHDISSTIRSPSPPVPPPPPPPVRSRSKRVSKGIRNAFKTLNSMKGELRKTSLLTEAVNVNGDDSSVSNDTLVVRVRHITDVHRFSMNKTDMFYSLQQQMAVLLKVEADQVGFFLRDCRLAPSDTPQSIQLHLADIIECHVLVSGDGDSRASHTDSDSIRVLMQCPNSRQNSHMDINSYLPFRVLFEKYAKMKGKPVECFKFYFDGELLKPDMLPSSVDLDNDDTIDVVEVN